LEPLWLILCSCGKGRGKMGNGKMEYWNDGFMGKIENILKMLKWDNE